jgi:hypothetical protein
MVIFFPLLPLVYILYANGAVPHSVLSFNFIGLALLHRFRHGDRYLPRHLHSFRCLS